MNNIKKYDEFISEELKFKDIKYEIKMRFALTLLYCLKLFYSKNIRKKINKSIGALREFKRIKLFLRKNEFTKINNMSEKDQINFVKSLENKYDNEFNSSLKEDIMEILNKADKRSEKIKTIIRMKDILCSKNDFSEIDPYGEETWEEDNSFYPDDIYSDHGQHGDNAGAFSIVNYWRRKLIDKVIGKTITFLPLEYDDAFEEVPKFRKKIKVKDAHIRQGGYYGLFYIIFTDENGKEYEVSRNEKINILD